MTAIAIVQEKTGNGTASYCAVAGGTRSEGRTAGEALDALTNRLGDAAEGTWVIVQHFRPDRFFTKAQRERLEKLMASWRAAREGRGALSPEEKRELEALIQAELGAAKDRAASLCGEFAP